MPVIDLGNGSNTSSLRELGNAVGSAGSIIDLGNYGVTPGQIIELTDSYVGPLDLLDTAAAAAYSTRRLDVNYQGAALRVRRSSDSSEQDIGFTSGGDLDQTALISFVGKNMIQNSSTTGAVAGTPGTLPNNWFAPTTNLGLNRTVVGFGTSGGLPYVDVRYNGVLSGAGDTTITPATNNSIVAATGETWVHSVTLSVVAGALPVSVNTRIGLIENNGAGAFLASSANTFGSAAITGTPTQFTLTRLFNQATTAFAQVAININATASDIGNTIDFTLRIAGWQLERNSLSSYFLTTGNAAGGGFVTTLYDQSGNSRNATQAVAAQQAAVVRSGVITTTGSNNRASSDFVNSASNFYATPNVSVAANPALEVFSVCSNLSNLEHRIVYLGDSAGTVGGILGMLSSDYSIRYNNGNVIFGTGTTGASEILNTYRNAGANYQTAFMRQNNSQLTVTSSVNGTALPNLIGPNFYQIGASRIGGVPSSFAQGRIAEVIIFHSVISDTERNAIARNQGQYYGITVA